MQYSFIHKFSVFGAFEYTFAVTHTVYNGNYYIFGSRLGDYKFDEAREECKKHHSHLASVLSLKEHNFIVSEIKKLVWDIKCTVQIC